MPRSIASTDSSPSLLSLVSNAPSAVSSPHTSGLDPPPLSRVQRLLSVLHDKSLRTPERLYELVKCQEDALEALAADAPRTDRWVTLVQDHFRERAPDPQLSAALLVFTTHLLVSAGGPDAGGVAFYRFVNLCLDLGLRPKDHAPHRALASVTAVDCLAEMETCFPRALRGYVDAVAGAVDAMQGPGFQSALLLLARLLGHHRHPEDPHHQEVGVGVRGEPLDAHVKKLGLLVGQHAQALTGSGAWQLLAHLMTHHNTSTGGLPDRVRSALSERLAAMVHSNAPFHMLACTHYSSFLRTPQLQSVLMAHRLAVLDDPFATIAQRAVALETSQPINSAAAPPSNALRVRPFDQPDHVLLKAPHLASESLMPLAAMLGPDPRTPYAPLLIRTAAARLLMGTDGSLVWDALALGFRGKPQFAPQLADLLVAVQLTCPDAPGRILDLLMGTDGPDAPERERERRCDGLIVYLGRVWTILSIHDLMDGLQRLRGVLLSCESRRERAVLTPRPRVSAVAPMRVPWTEWEARAPDRIVLDLLWAMQDDYGARLVQSVPRSRRSYLLRGSVPQSERSAVVVTAAEVRGAVRLERQHVCGTPECIRLQAKLLWDQTEKDKDKEQEEKEYKLWGAAHTVRLRIWGATSPVEIPQLMEGDGASFAVSIRLPRPCPSGVRLTVMMDCVSLRGEVLTMQLTPEWTISFADTCYQVPSTSAPPVSYAGHWVSFVPYVSPSTVREALSGALYSESPISSHQLQDDCRIVGGAHPGVVFEMVCSGVNGGTAVHVAVERTDQKGVAAAIARLVEDVLGRLQPVDGT
jgi:hypothetical protein